MALTLILSLVEYTQSFVLAFLQLRGSQYEGSRVVG